MLDPDELVRVAGHIDAHATALRTRARTLGHATTAAHWQSTAATDARSHMHHTITRITTAAQKLEHAAHELRAHAQAVRTVEHAFMAAQRVGKAVIHDGKVVVHDIGSVGRHTGHAAGEAVSFLAHHLT